MGRRTRQIEILLNSALITEEKRRIKADIKALDLRNDAIESELKVMLKEITLLDLAVAAIRRGSKNTIKQAGIRIESMFLELLEFKLRADSIKAIDAAKKYIVIGGEKSYQELSEIIIPELTTEKQSIEERIKCKNF